jgi:hypothetical protein
VKDLIDEIIAEEFSSPDLELHWLDEDADAAGLEASLEGRVKLGAVTLNEMRESLGLDPYANPAADRPMVLTPTGYVPIEANAGEEDATANANDRSAPTVQKFDSDKPFIFADQPSVGELPLKLRKYGYNPEEPRIPKHNAGGGQWTQVAANDDPNDASDAPDNSSFPVQKYGRGHHWVPRVVFENRNFSKEKDAVFEKSTSGPLADPTINQNTVEHREYNDAINELLDAFLKKNNITDEQMTPAQAGEFVQEVIGSSDPVIRGFVIKIRQEVWRYIRRYGPWRRGGGGEDD